MYPQAVVWRAVEDYPRNLAEFERRFGTEEVCRDYLVQLRWPDGFHCPRCECGKFWPQRIILLQCAACDYQSSVTAGTIFQDTHAPLTLWFRAIWYITLSVAAKKGTILAAMAVTGPQPSNWSLSLLIGRLVQNGPESVKGAPLLGAAKRTLDGEDRSEIVT